MIPVGAARYLSTAVLLLIAWSGQAGAQSAMPPSAPDYFPIKAGACWHYIVPLEGRPVRETARIVHTSSAPEGEEVTLEWKRDGRPGQREVYRVTPTEVLRLRTGMDARCQISPPLPLLRLPLRAGQRWHWHGTFNAPEGAIPGKTILTVSGPEAVALAGGTVQAMRVRADTELIVSQAAWGGGRTRQARPHVTEDYWFAPDVGLVKQQLFTDAQSLELRLTRYQPDDGRLNGNPRYDFMKRGTPHGDTTR